MFVEYAVVRYGSADIWWFRIFLGFVLCVEAIFGICPGVWSCPPAGQSMMLMIRPGL